MCATLCGGGILVGVDLVKDPALLHAAYNDSMGVTAAFNKNLLSRANRELAADFNLDTFVHYAPYNAAAQRVEMYLVSAMRQSVRIAGQRVTFADGEALHTEDFAQIHARQLPRAGRPRRIHAPCGLVRPRQAVQHPLAGVLMPVQMRAQMEQ